MADEEALSDGRCVNGLRGREVRRAATLCRCRPEDIKIKVANACRMQRAQLGKAWRNWMLLVFNGQWGRAEAARAQE